MSGDVDLERVTVNDLDATGLEVTGPPTSCAERTSSADSGTLDLSDLRAESITLAQAVVDELVLQGAQVAGRANIELALLNCEASFDGLAADSLTVDLSAVDAAGPAARQSMYKTIVETAKEGGDLELANEATYRRYVDLNSGDAWPKATLDNVFYRGMAGYMVKPLRPLVCLLLLWLVGTMVRYVTSIRQTAGGPPLTGKSLTTSAWPSARPVGPSSARPRSCPLGRTCSRGRASAGWRSIWRRRSCS